MRKPSTKILLIVGLVAVAILVLTAGIVVWQVVDWGGDDDCTIEDHYLAPSNSVLGKYSKAAIATDAPYCSEIGKATLEKPSATVADAAIATMLCVGLIQSQSCGLGGGFLLVHYDRASKKATTLNARERAPGAATQDMFKGDPDASARGNLSVAVPGELKGYWALWNKYGGLQWKELFEPTINLAVNGFNLTAHAANALRSNSAVIKTEPTLAEIFVNPATGEVYLEGDLIKRPKLAETLRTIADAPAGEEDALYRDTPLMQNFVKDLRDRGGIITEEDMKGYQVSWDDPVEMEIQEGFKVHSIPPPGSGLLLAFSMKLLSGFGPLREKDCSTSQRIVESFKHAYAKRTILGDPQSTDPIVKAEVAALKKDLTDNNYINSILAKIDDDSTSNDYAYYGAEFYQPDDHGTAHMCIIAPNGDAIALTSTINLYFGSRIRSVNTGIIYNDEMDDFSSPNITNQFGVPPSKNNFIEPGKRPVSSMTPAIFTDKQGKVRLVVGGAGGTKITTAVASVAMRNLWFGENIKEAIDARRIHHQLYPMQVQYEEGFNPNIIKRLENIGHQTDSFAVGTSVIQGIAVAENGTIYANSDFRKVGTVAGI